MISQRDYYSAVTTLYRYSRYYKNAGKGVCSQGCLWLLDAIDAIWKPKCGEWGKKLAQEEKKKAKKNVQQTEQGLAL